MTRVLPDGRVEFRCYRPDASRIKLAGSFSDWQPLADLTPEFSEGRLTGHWYLRLPLTPGEHAFRYEVDGRHHVDFTARLAPVPGSTALSSTVTVPTREHSNR